MTPSSRSFTMRDSDSGTTAIPRRGSLRPSSGSTRMVDPMVSSSRSHKSDFPRRPSLAQAETSYRSAIRERGGPPPLRRFTLDWAKEERVHPVKSRNAPPTPYSFIPPSVDAPTSRKSPSSTTISQRLRRAIIDDDLIAAKRLAKHAMELASNLSPSQDLEMSSPAVDGAPELVSSSVAKRAWQRQKAHLSTETCIIAVHRRYQSGTMLQGGARSPRVAFSIRNAAPNAIPPGTSSSAAHASSLVGAETAGSEATSKERDGHLVTATAIIASTRNNVPQPRYHRESLEAEQISSKTSLELAIEYGCTVPLIEWLLTMGHEEVDDAGRLVTFTRDPQERTIPYLAAMWNRPDVVGIYCTHLHFLLSVPDQAAFTEPSAVKHLERRPRNGGKAKRPTSVVSDSDSDEAAPTVTRTRRKVQTQREDREPQESIITQILDYMDSVEGKTALHEAALRGHEEVVRRLLDLGASVDAQDYFGNTPLHYASAWGQLGCVGLLIERGAGAIYDVQNQHGFTAADYAYTVSGRASLEAMGKKWQAAAKEKLMEEEFEAMQAQAQAQARAQTEAQAAAVLAQASGGAAAAVPKRMISPGPQERERSISAIKARSPAMSSRGGTEGAIMSPDAANRYARSITGGWDDEDPPSFSFNSTIPSRPSTRRLTSTGSPHSPPGRSRSPLRMIRARSTTPSMSRSDSHDREGDQHRLSPSPSLHYADDSMMAASPLISEAHTPSSPVPSPSPIASTSASQTPSSSHFLPHLGSRGMSRPVSAAGSLLRSASAKVAQVAHHHHHHGSNNHTSPPPSRSSTFVNDLGGLRGLNLSPSPGGSRTASPAGVSATAQTPSGCSTAAGHTSSTSHREGMISSPPPSSPPAPSTSIHPPSSPAANVSLASPPPTKSPIPKWAVPVQGDEMDQEGAGREGQAEGALYSLSVPSPPQPQPQPQPQAQSLERHRLGSSTIAAAPDDGVNVDERRIRNRSTAKMPGSETRLRSHSDLQ